MQRKQIKQYISSPLNYQGGKARILDQLLPIFPTDIDIFVDLFCGGCNVGMNVEAERVIYNDCSKPLIGLLRAFRRMSKETIINGINALIDEFGFSQTRYHNFAYYGGGANYNPQNEMFNNRKTKRYIFKTKRIFFVSPSIMQIM